MPTTKSSNGRARAAMHPGHHVSQAFSQERKLPIALDDAACRKSVENLNQLLADTMTLRDLYKKSHWQVTGPNFYSLHLLFDKHFGEQAELVDTIAERVMMLGGVSIAMAQDVAETSIIPRPPRGRETAEAEIERLLAAHEMVIEEARAMARDAAQVGDDGTNDMIVGDVIRTHEMQVWFLAEHVTGAHR